MATETDPPVLTPPSAPTRGSDLGDLVVLRERELADGDLGRAIAVLRARPETARSRILVIAADEPEPAGDEAEQGNDLLIVDPTRQERRRGETEGLAAAARMTAPIASCLLRYLDEAETALDQLVAGAAGGDPDKADTEAKLLREIFSWARAAVEDLGQQAAAGGAGFRATDTFSLLREVVAARRQRWPAARIEADLGGASTCLARTEELAEAMALGLSLAAGSPTGPVRLLARGADGHLLMRFRGFAPAGPGSRAAVDQLGTLVARQGGSVSLAEFRDDGVALSLRFPLLA